MADAGQLGTAAYVMERVLAGQISDRERHIAQAWLNRYEARNAAEAAALAAEATEIEGR